MPNRKNHITSVIEKNTIYSTKHGVKGTEFDNVLVIVDDSAWRNFSDNEVFSNNKHNINRYDRSRNSLHVRYSRPKKRLALYSITRAPTLRRQQAFGSDRTICINNVNNIYAFIPRNKSSRLPTE